MIVHVTLLTNNTHSLVPKKHTRVLDGQLTWKDEATLTLLPNLPRVSNLTPEVAMATTQQLLVLCEDWTCTSPGSQPQDHVESKVIDGAYYLEKSK